METTKNSTKKAVNQQVSEILTLTSSQIAAKVNSIKSSIEFNKLSKNLGFTVHCSDLNELGKVKNELIKKLQDLKGKETKPTSQEILNAAKNAAQLTKEVETSEILPVSKDLQPAKDAKVKKDVLPSETTLNAKFDFLQKNPLFLAMLQIFAKKGEVKQVVWVGANFDRAQQINGFGFEITKPHNNDLIGFLIGSKFRCYNSGQISSPKVSNFEVIRNLYNTEIQAAKVASEVLEVAK